MRWDVAVRDRSQAKGNARLLAYALASRADDKGECFPSLSTLTADTGLSKWALVRASHRLEELDELAVSRSPRRGRNAVNRYRLIGALALPKTGRRLVRSAPMNGAADAPMIGAPVEPEDSIEDSKKGGAAGLAPPPPLPKVSCSRCGSFRFLGGYRDSKPLCNPCLDLKERMDVA